MIRFAALATLAFHFAPAACWRRYANGGCPVNSCHRSRVHSSSGSRRWLTEMQEKGPVYA